MGVVLPTIEVPMESSDFHHHPCNDRLNLAIVARPWAGSASPHTSQPIANRHRAGDTVHSVTNGWLLVSGWSAMKRDTHHVRMAIVVSSS